MRVIIEADSIASQRMSGIGHATLEIIRNLDARMAKGDDIDVTIIVPHGTENIIRGYGFKSVRCRVFPKGQKYINYALTRTGLPIPMTVFFGRGTYIFPNYKTWYTPFARSLTFVHDVAFRVHPETINPKNLKYLNTNFRRWVRRATKIITISHATAHEFSEFYPESSSKVAVVPLGINTEVFRPQSSRAQRQVREKYALPEKFFLFVGNLEPRKNISRLLAAYKSYVDQGLGSLPLVLISGGGWKDEDIKKRIATMSSNGYAVCKPEVYVADEDLPAVYSSAAALVHVAVHEGFGLPPIQAQACGVPALLSDIPALREFSSNSKSIFVDPLDEANIASGLSEVEVLNHQPHPHVNYTWSKTVDDLLSVIVLGRKD